MRRMKCFLAVLLSIFLTMSAIPVGAGFGDVDSGNTQAEAIEVLSGLGLIAGYQEGEQLLFKPQGQITRAEFTAMLTRALKLAEIGETAETPFVDVATDHWASANIRVAYDLKIIRGYDETHFGPEDNVTYEQAIKMMVCALGFENQAVSRGGYPSGYLMVANDKGLLKKLNGTGSAPATRADVAQMIYNAFDVDIAMEVGVGEDGTPQYVVEKGKTLLTEKLELCHVSGQVTGIDMTRLDNPVGVQRDSSIEVAGIIVKVAEDTDQSALLGRMVEVYYKNNPLTDENTAEYIYLPTNKNKTVTIDHKKIENVTNQALTYTTADGESETADYTSLKMIYNKKQRTGSPASVLNIQTGSVTLLDADADGNYDVAFISEYEPFCVYQVDTVRSTVVNRYNTADIRTIKPSVSKTGDQLKIYKNDAEVAVSSIGAWTTLCIYESKNLTGDKYTEIYVSPKSVNGKITRIQDDLYTIGGNNYGVTQYYKDAVTAGSARDLVLGLEATFYLDLYGNIVASNVTSSATTNLYGYVIDASYNALTELLSIKLLPAGGSSISTYICADSTTVDGVPLTDHAQIQARLATAASATNRDAGNSNATYSQVIRYGVKDGKINAINTNYLNAATETTTSNLRLYDSGTEISGTYRDTNKKFEVGVGITANSSTKIFVVPSDRSHTSEYATTLNLRDGSVYAVEAYNMSTLSVAGALVIYGGITLDQVTPTSPFYIVSGDLEGILDVNGNSIWSVPLIDVQTGASTTIQTESDDTFTTPIAKGDVIRFLTNSEGAIRKGTVEISFSPTASLPAATDREYNDTAALRTRIGTIYSKDISTKSIAFTSIFPSEGSSVGARDTYSCASAKIYVYDRNATSEELRIIPHNASSTNLAYAQTISDVPAGTDPSVVFLHLSNSAVKFVYIVY